MGSILDLYKKELENSTDEEFPEQMQGNGLSAEDEEAYKKALQTLRSEIDEYNNELKTKKVSGVSEAIAYANEDGVIKNRSYKINTDKLSEEYQRSITNNSDGGMIRVSEPFGFSMDAYRCPKCGSLLKMERGNDKNRFFCPLCDYEEYSEKKPVYYLVENTLKRIPLSEELQEKIQEIFNSLK